MFIMPPSYRSSPKLTLIASDTALNHPPLPQASSRKASSIITPCSVRSASGVEPRRRSRCIILFFSSRRQKQLRLRLDLGERRERNFPSPPVNNPQPAFELWPLRDVGGKVGKARASVLPSGGKKNSIIPFPLFLVRSTAVNDSLMDEEKGRRG